MFSPEFAFVLFLPYVSFKPTACYVNYKILPSLLFQISVVIEQGPKGPAVQNLKRPCNNISSTYENMVYNFQSRLYKSYIYHCMYFQTYFK